MRAIVCPYCDATTFANVRGRAEWDGYNPDGSVPIGPPVEWALVQCGTCRQAAVQLREDYGGGFDDDDAVFVYPRRRQLSWDVPDAVRRDWQEAAVCFQAKAYTACLVMVRRALEGTCELQGVKKGRLEKRLGTLREQGLIDGTLAEWADALRLVGNRGAHFSGEATAREDAEDALDFAEALLDHVYVLRERFQRFAARRAGQSGS
jgi:hypothetical protein